MFGAFVATFWTSRLNGKDQYHADWIDWACVRCRTSMDSLRSILDEALKEMGR